MDFKEIRKIILEFLYDRRSDFGVNPRDLLTSIGISDKVLDTEIRYLEGKGLVRVSDRCMMGGNPLNFVDVKITSEGIDLVEDPEKFDKLFTIKISNNNFGNVNNGILSIGSGSAEQTISSSLSKEEKRWHQKWWMQFIVFPLLVGLSIAFLVFYLSWNK